MRQWRKKVAALLFSLLNSHLTIACCYKIHMFYCCCCSYSLNNVKLSEVTKLIIII